ncbi:hypothetical protein Q1695_016174 [Nippostrongylus brasiliensis]|nr:hypothetical protein Q1695_016174 [Nippostrongylus brasiliensis]
MGGPITPEPYYDDSKFMELTNDSVYRGFVYYVILLFMFIAVIGMILYGMKLHYRVRLTAELERIRDQKEPNRVFYIEAGSGAQRIVPPPLTPPITDQYAYNPFANRTMEEIRRAAI